MAVAGITDAVSPNGAVDADGFMSFIYQQLMAVSCGRVSTVVQQC